MNFKLIFLFILLCCQICFIQAQRYTDESQQEEPRNQHSTSSSYYQMIGDILNRKPTYYDLLGLVRDTNRSVTAAEVRRAYRKLALQSHPDKQREGGASNTEEEWAAINFAKEVLSDDELRRQYHDLLDHGVPLSEKYYGRYAHQLGLHLDARILLFLIAVLWIVGDHLVRRSSYQYYMRLVSQHGTIKNMQRHSKEQVDVQITNLPEPNFGNSLPFRLWGTAKHIFGVLVGGPLTSFYRHVIKGEKRLTREEEIAQAEEAHRLQLNMTPEQYAKYKKKKLAHMKDTQRNILASNKFKKYRRMLKKMNQ